MENENGDKGAEDQNEINISEIAYALGDFKGLGKDQVNLNVPELQIDTDFKFCFYKQ